MASKRGLRRRQCGNKLKLTKEEAIKKAWKMGLDRPGQSFDGYKCMMCGSWHVGHRTRQSQQKISARRQLSNAKA